MTILQTWTTLQGIGTASLTLHSSRYVTVNKFSETTQSTLAQWRTSMCVEKYMASTFNFMAKQNNNEQWYGKSVQTSAKDFKACYIKLGCPYQPQNELNENCLQKPNINNTLIASACVNQSAFCYFNASEKESDAPVLWEERLVVEESVGTFFFPYTSSAFRNGGRVFFFRNDRNGMKTFLHYLKT